MDNFTGPEHADIFCAAYTCTPWGKYCRSDSPTYSLKPNQDRKKMEQIFSSQQSVGASSYAREWSCRLF